MKVKINKQLLLDALFWGLAVIWCAVIFSFSSQNGGESGETSSGVCRFIASVVVNGFSEMSEVRQNEIVEGMQFFVRKTAHFCAYGLLGFLISLALRRKKPLLMGALSVLLSCLYAISDELHQLTVSDRSAQLSDVLLDTSGAVAGFLAAWAVIALIRRSRGNSG